MKYLVTLITLIVTLNSHAEYVWRSGVPNHVQLVSGGLVVLGDFSNSPESEITCDSAHLNGFYLPSNDPDMDKKISMALMALASGKVLVAHIADIDNDCTHVSAVGSLPIAHTAYWTVKN